MATKKNTYIYSLAFLALLVAGTLKLSAHSPKCPDDFGTDDAGSAAYLASTDKFTNDFFDQNPDASLTDWANARHQFWVDNHCVAALERYEQAKAGNADPKTMEAVNKVIEETLSSRSQ